MCLWSFTEMNLNSQNWCKPKKPPFAVAFLLAASYLLILFCTSDILHLEQPKWEWIFCIYDLHQPESFPWSHIFCFPDTAAPQQIEKHQIWYTNVYLELTEINLNPRNDANQYFFIKLFFFKRNTICNAWIFFLRVSSQGNNRFTLPTMGATSSIQGSGNGFPSSQISSSFSSSCTVQKQTP